MKRIIYLMATIILVLALTIGCTRDKDEADKLDEDQTIIDSEEVDPSQDQEQSTEDILNDFSGKVESSLAEAGDFIGKNMDKLTSIEVDKMVTELISRTEEGVMEARKEIENIDLDKELDGLFAGDLYLTQEQVDNLKNDELKEVIKRLEAENYRLINLEGQYYPFVNYEGFKKYDDFVSDELRDYVDLKARDANKPLAIDAGLYISYEELADRILATENYIKKYGDGDRYGEVINMYRNKLDMYLLGLPNTPIADRDTNMIKEDLMNSYKQTALIKDSSTGFIVGKYIGIIDRKQGLIDDEVRNEALMLLEEATELIGTGK